MDIHHPSPDADVPRMAFLSEPAQTSTGAKEIRVPTGYIFDGGKEDVKHKD